MLPMAVARSSSGVVAISYVLPVLCFVKALVWPVATYIKSWTLGKNEETRVDAFEMKWPRKMYSGAHLWLRSLSFTEV